MISLETRIAQVKALARNPSALVIDRSPWKWYALTCPCGLPLQAHLPQAFLSQIVGLYENTRLGRQEIHAEFLDTTEGVWFTNFDPARHVSVEAEYHPGFYVRCAIDAGTSRHTGAVFFQLRPSHIDGRPRVIVFAEYHGVDVVSQRNAHAIKGVADDLPCRGRIDVVRLDPAATARSSLGPAAYGEYERVFGSRIVA